MWQTRGCLLGWGRDYQLGARDICSPGQHMLSALLHPMGLGQLMQQPLCTASVQWVELAASDLCSSHSFQVHQALASVPWAALSLGLSPLGCSSCTPHAPCANVSPPPFTPRCRTSCTT